ncbi:hypothetical protein XA68_11605 [Ophiocordyceps unilateralis]|uniref:Secreted protein n=1 Tax=Ophiocordyceps unilateralis TaxID=268505 RepID=A0A2A9P232_OPHUN|nr:hypothetical protein XA68_11605 [Ophiocordyceps unilateralis]
MRLSVLVLASALVSGDFGPGKLGPGVPRCLDDGWMGENGPYIYEGIKYLRSQDLCQVPPASCSRVSCSWSQAIVMCNENPEASFRASCRTLAFYARAVVEKCRKRVEDRDSLVDGFWYTYRPGLVSIPNTQVHVKVEPQAC